MFVNIINLKSLAKLPAHAWSLVAISFALFSYNAITHGGYAVDDAYIGFRFLDNWLNGYGLVFNPGEQVEGYTNFLWLVALAPLRLVGIPAEGAALLINVLCVLIVAYASYQSVSRLTADNLTSAISVWLLIAGYGSFCYWLTAGMEPLMMTALLCWANAVVLQHNRITALSAVLFAAAVLTRPDAALFAVIAFMFYFPWQLLKEKRKLLDYIYNGVIFALPLAFHLLWRWSYYGELLPNTYYAKMHPNSGLMYQFGVAYLDRFLWAGGAVLFAVTILGLANRSLWSRFSLMLVTQIIVFCLYIIKVGGDYMLYFRFFIPLIPLLCILTAVVISKWSTQRKLPSWINSIIITTLSLSMTIALAQSSDMEQAPGVRQAHSDNEIFSTWLLQTFPHDTVIAMNLVGLVPYRTGFKTIDMLGLTDKHIARGKIAQLRVGPGSYIGHFKYDGEYVCSLMPDVMFPTTIMLHPAPNAEQARLSVMNRSYDSDRDFWLAPACKHSYEAHFKELQANKFVVMYVNKAFLSELDQR